MNTSLNKIISHLAEKTDKLFLIDSLGAFLTAFFLFVIMRPLNEYFGMPKTILNHLSLTAICFCVYSTFCFLFYRRLSANSIIVIGCANLLYCGLTTLLIIKYYNQLTILGLLYFLVEVLFICGLSYIELNVASEIKKRRTQNKTKA